MQSATICSRFLPLLIILLFFPSANIHVTAYLFSVEYGSPATYLDGDVVPLIAFPMTSIDTQIDTSYRDLPFCQPLEGPTGGSLAMWLPYEVQVLEEVRCKKLCQVNLTAEQAKMLSLHIKNGYHHNWKLDNLPAANLGTSKHYGGGFPVGFVTINGEDTYVFNHAKLVVDYFQMDKGYRIVGFGVEPTSVKHYFSGGYEWDGVKQESLSMPLETCPSSTDSDFVTQDVVQEPQVIIVGEQVLFTYDVTWVKSEVEWSQRWEIYLTEDHIVPDQVHIYSIVNSITVATFLSVVVSCILVQNLKRDMSSSRGQSNDDDEQKGWKALGGHVFRPPQTLPHLFCAMVGTGAQLALTGVLVLLLAIVNIVSPAKPGSLGIAIYIIYIFFGSPVAGYVSGRLYGVFGGQDGNECASLTTLLFPAIVFAFHLAFSLTPSVAKVSWIEVLTWAASSFLVSSPLIHETFRWGHLQGKSDNFLKVTAEVDRTIPPPTFQGYCTELIYLIFTGVSPYCAAMTVPWVTVLSTGLFTLASVYVELFYIMISMFMHRYYWTFGFALVVYIIMIATCSALTMLFVYHRLNNENHQWWWPAFFVGGSISFHLLVYSFVWVGTLEISSSYWASSNLLYFGQMFIISFGAFLLCGSMGSLAALGFVRTLFSTLGPLGDANYVKSLSAIGDHDEAVEEEEVMPMNEAGT